MRAIPTINTARLTLRAMRAQDFGRFAEIWSAAEPNDRVTDGAPDAAGVWARFLRNAGHWQVMGYGHWAIEPRGARQMMGLVGFFLDRDRTDTAGLHWPEAGWVLHADARGQGLGAEAAQAAHDWFDRVITGPLICRIPPQNERAMSIAERLGYTHSGSLPEREEDLVAMTRRAPPDSPRNILADLAACDRTAANRR